MLHGYEEATIVPAMDLYDSGMMQQMIAAARELYLQSLNDLDNFYKTYGDFLSPSLADMNYYYDNTTGRVANLLNYAQANGIDLLRSAEGRALAANVVRNVPYARLAAMRLNAKDLEVFNKLAAQAKANGTWGSDEALEFLSGGFNPNTFSTIDQNGNIVMVGDRTPFRIRSMNEATADFYKGRTAHELNQKSVESFGMKYDPRYKYVGFDYNDLLNTAGSQTQGWETTPEGRWYYEVARRKVAAAGGDPNDANSVQAQLNTDVAEANRRFLIAPSSEADKYEYLNASTQAQNWLDKLKSDRDFDNWKKLQKWLADPKNNPSLITNLPVTFTDSAKNDTYNRQNDRIVESATAIASDKIDYYRAKLASNNAEDRKHRKKWASFLNWWTRAYQDPAKYLLKKNSSTGVYSPSKFMVDKYNEYQRANFPTRPNSTNIAEWKNNNTQRLTGAEAEIYNNSVLFRGAKLAKLPGTQENMYVSTFGDNGVKLEIPYVTKLNGRSLTGGSKSKQLENWLEHNKVRVYTPTNAAINLYMSPAISGNRTATMHNAFYTAYIASDDVDKFVEYKTGIKIDNSDANNEFNKAKNRIIKQYGLKPAKVGNTTQYTINVALQALDERNATAVWAANASADKTLFGTSFASGNAVNRQAAGLQGSVGR